MMHRRSLLLGLGSLLAAPVTVRADALMKVRPWPEHPLVAFREIYRGIERTVTWSEVQDATSYSIYRTIDIDAMVRRYAAIHDAEHMLIGAR